MPERKVLSRRKGARLGGAVSVARPSRWGNPYVVVERAGRWDVLGPSGRVIDTATTARAARALAVAEFRTAVLHGRRTVPPVTTIRDRLKGLDLACWCPLDGPCHADVLLELANAERVYTHALCGACDGVGHLGPATHALPAEYGRACPHCDGSGAVLTETNKEQA